MTNPQDAAGDHLRRMVTRLVPTLSRSLAEQFNVFRVMHHGTHEKQLSNVFAWLLDAEGTHGLGDAFQRIFVARVNAQLPPEDRLPEAGYRVVQEADTRGEDEVAAGGGRDIADIVLSRPDAAVVVENYSVSDGHGHGYQRYLAHGRTGGRRAAVAMLCMRHEAHLLGAGWEEAAVLTYADLIAALADRIGSDRRWRAAHPDQHFFIRQLHQHFVEAPQAVDTDDTLDFLTALCATGESARYGRRPIAAAEDAKAPEPPEAPDYSRLFVTRHGPAQDGIDVLIQTDVTLAEVLDGLSPEDTRLVDALLEAASRPVL